MKLPERIFKRKDYQITSPFGTRVNPITGAKGEFHDGVDYGTHGEKWPQYGIEKGRVLSCGVDTNYGNAKFVWVEYPRLGFKLLHYHLNEIKVVKGQEVDENTIIGTTGKTGYATGIHLHLGMKFLNNNTYVDAEAYDYKPSVEILTTSRNEKKHQVEITIPNLNARDSANGNLLGVYVPQGIYNVLNEKEDDEYRWVEINVSVWCALVEKGYIEYSVAGEIDYKKLYLEVKAKLDEIHKLSEV